MKLRMLPLLAGLFVTLFAQGISAQTVNVQLRVQNAAGTPVPCSASLLSADFTYESVIVNGSPSAPANMSAPTGLEWHLDAEAGAGYEFVEWKVVSSEVAPVGFSDGLGWVPSMNWPDPSAYAKIVKTCRLVAVFQLAPPSQMELVVSHDGNALAVSPAVGTHLYNSGTVVTLNASPVANYEFLRWEDPLVPGTPHPDVDINTSYVPPRYSIVMDGDYAVKAVFGRRLTVTASNPTGPATAAIVTTHSEGSIPTISVPNPLIYEQVYQRLRCIGWISGTAPGIPATGGSATYTFTSPIIVNNALSWQWQREFRVLAQVGGAGVGSIPQLALFPEENWFATGTLLTLNAVPGAQSVFTGWIFPAGVTPVTGDSTTAQITLNVNQQIDRLIAQFQLISEDSDNDGLPDEWEIGFGLDPFNATGLNGSQGDPDNDGLTNQQEFNLFLGSPGVYLASDPLDADTDGDGMIDGWEYRMFISESIADETIIPASLDDGSYAPNSRYGQFGNPDGDHLWDTATGWETTLPLYNWLEYLGPDGIVPYLITPVTSASLGLPSGATVQRASVNPADSVPHDTSHPLNIDSDNDLYDDGYEYSWDRWQQVNDGALMTVNAALWPGITEDVQTMIGAWVQNNRPFNPAVPKGTWVSLGEATYDNSVNMDLDYWFDQTFGVIDPLRPLTDLDEYLASALASSTNLVTGTVPVAYPVLRPARGGTTTRWSTNPFVWDSDGDGLPDGWELTFGFDPWAARSLSAGTPANRTDATFNPDRDGYAFDDPLRNNAVYTVHGFNPNTGYGRLQPTGTITFGAHTAAYDNYQELLGVTIDSMVNVGSMTLLNQPDWRSTHPLKVDSDDDGIYDGWEAYVGLDPLDADDAPLDQPYDADGLTNFEEFDSAATSPGMTNAAYRVADWYNKRLPTDPWDPDTDLDQMTDSSERDQFNDGGPQAVNGGLCPTTVDTDGDFLPDSWETYYGVSRWTDDTNAVPTSVNGTLGDAFADPDGDTLLNYQEYMTGTMYHWQFQHVDANGYGITVFEPSVKPMGLYQYDPYDYLNPAIYGRQPYAWDEHYLAIGSPPAVRPVPYTYLGGCNYAYFIAIPQFSTTDPGMRDSDLDMMDDFYEIYHGLNPVYGFNDLVRRKYFIGGTVDAVLANNNLLDEYDAPFVPQPPDLRRYPWMAGDPLQDPDQDQILTIDEAILIDGPVPPATHTDPSPLWMTDLSSPHSWVNQFYWLGDTMGQYPAYWFWDGLTLLTAMGTPPPSYMFSFEMNDGFDTDNDGIADRAELVHNSSISPGVTDPLDSMSPLRRRALYLEGNDSAARTATGYAHTMDDLRRFTVEVWARPANPQRGARQTIIERTGFIPQGNPELPAASLLANFNLGIDADGRPYAYYNGNAQPYLFTEAKASPAFTLNANEWVHLAATFDGPEDLDSTQTGGMWVGMLNLYVNGQLAASVPSSEIPVNGVIGGIGIDPNNTNEVIQTGTIVPMSVNVGASDANAGTMIHGDEILVGPAIHLLPGLPPPVFFDYFQGHIDEIRIWDRGRTQAAIIARMRDRFTRTEVSRLADEEALRYCYTFDDLPDPSTLTAPVGFASIMGRPIGYFSSPWWGNASVRSEWYDDYRWIPWIENLVAHRPLTLPLDATHPAVEIAPDGSTHALYPNTSNPYTLWYRTGTRMAFEDHPFLGNDDENEWGAEGLWGELPIYPDLLPCGFARTDESVPLWDNGTPGSADYDSDGDGLPDDWEVAHGMDPFNPADAFLDLDDDGLNSLQEFYAGTSPILFDSDGDGINDYEDTSAGSARMNGVRFTDNDYVEDLWEDGFVPAFATSKRYDEHYDLDSDGWNNGSERRFSPPTSPDLEQSQADSNGVIRAEYPTPSLIVTLDYLGLRDLRVVNPTLVVHAYTDPYMNGMPDAVYRVPLATPDIWPITLTLSTNDLQIGHLRQGLNWFYAFVDLDGSQRAIIGSSVTWLTWTAGEPAAVADGQIPGIDIGWDRNEVRFTLVDEARSSARLSWEGLITDSQPHTISIYHAVANTLVFTRSFAAPRTWLHEGDIMAAKTQEFGLGWGVASGTAAYRWTLDGISRGYVTNVYGVTAPGAVTDPRLDDIVQEARPEFRWRMSPEATEFEIEIRKGSAAGTVVYLGRHLAPNRREYTINVNDLCVWRFPYHAGNVMPNGQTLSNDTYYWKVKAYSPAATAGGAWSDQPSFRLDVNTSIPGSGGYGWCTVNVRYPGLAALAGGAPIRVQAFRSRSFNGIADAEKQLSAAGSVTLAGLVPGLYYFRAYVDQNNNRQRDNWESYGYLRDLVNASEPFRVVGAEASALGTTPTVSLTIRDADTDNDLIPDATEYIMWGASGGDWLAKAGPGPIISSPAGTDYDGDGLNDASELDAGTSIFNIDSDGDGIPDLLDRDLLGFDPTAAERLRITGLDLTTGSIGWRWEAAGTGSGIVSLAEPGAEVISLGQTLNYTVEFTESLANPDWQPVSTISSGVSGGQVTLPQIRSASGFYRMRMLTE